MRMNIKGMSRAKILAALYNAAHPQGLGLLHFRPGDMTEADAEVLLKSLTYFDYLFGRVMKIHFDPDSDELDTRLYNRDNGECAAERAIDEAFHGSLTKDKPRPDFHREMCISRGYVPPTCTLDGFFSLLIATRGGDPCARCNMDRDKCKGRPKEGE